MGAESSKLPAMVGPAGTASIQRTFGSPPGVPVLGKRMLHYPGNHKGFRNSDQRPNSRTKDAPRSTVTQEIPRVSGALCPENQRQRPNIYFLLCHILWLHVGDATTLTSRDGGGRRESCVGRREGPQDFLRVTMFYDWGLDCLCVYICQNSQNCTPKIYAFHSIHLNL